MFYLFLLLMCASNPLGVNCDDDDVGMEGGNIGEGKDGTNGK